MAKKKFRFDISEFLKADIEKCRDLGNKVFVMKNEVARLDREYDLLKQRVRCESQLDCEVRGRPCDAAGIACVEIK